jgi:hypothetical protein
VIQVEQEGSFSGASMCILDQKIKQFQNQLIKLVKVQWTWYGPKDATWEHEDAIWVEYPHLLEGF